MEVLPHSGGTAFGTLARRLRAGGLVCLVADRDLSANGVEVDFFGEKTRLPAGPSMLAQQTGALLLPVTLWYDDTPVMRGRVHPPVEVPESGDRRTKTAAMTQELADAYASGIAEHPEDWHMLQRLWLADLEPRPEPPAGEAADGADAAGATGAADARATVEGTSGVSTEDGAGTADGAAGAVGADSVAGAADGPPDPSGTEKT
jgi:KDO2-lipid IV(A) lauroyltransferase